MGPERPSGRKCKLELLKQNAGDSESETGSSTSRGPPVRDPEREGDPSQSGPLEMTYFSTRVDS